jgi:hypothetical protein
MGIDTGLNIWTDFKPVSTLNTKTFPTTALRMERETGIEPVSLAWKAKVLPLNYSRPGATLQRQSLQTDAARRLLLKLVHLVEEAGFEPA